MKDAALQRCAAALLKASEPDPYCDSWAQANAAAARATESLRVLLQGLCPAGVRYGGVQRASRRVLHLFTDAALSGATFSLAPEELSAGRIAAELAERRAAFKRGQHAPVILP